MSVLGFAPLGTDLGPFGGPGLITILGVIPISANEIVVVCDRPPRALDDDAFDDALIESNYTLASIDPTVGDPPFIPPGEYKATFEPTVVHAAQDELDNQQIILSTDVKLEKHVRYELVVDFLEGAEGETFAGPNTWTFEALTPVPRYARVAQLGLATDPYNDFANGFVASSADGTTTSIGLTAGAGGQFMRHGGVESTRKRLHRRLLTARRRFLVLSPSYGTDFPVGSLARPSAIQLLVNDIAAGARSEPDVSAAECIAQVGEHGDIDITLRARVVDSSVVEVRQVIQL
jgi:hypothetical protein